MYQQNQQFYDPNSPKKKSLNSSPVGSPLKQPRTQFGSSTYSPVGKNQIIGKPIEIIKGKSLLKA